MSMLLIGCSVASEEPGRNPPPSPEYIGQVIVKFESAEQISSDILLSMQASDTPSRSVNRFAAALSDQVGIPFEATQITSGRELVLEVRSDTLLADLESQLSQQPDVAECYRTTDERSSPYRRDEVIVTFENDSDQYRALQNLQPTPDRPSPDVMRISEALTRDIAYPVTPRVLPSGQLALSIDTNALTQQLVDELTKRNDVSYAQPNFVMKHN